MRRTPTHNRVVNTKTQQIDSNLITKIGISSGGVGFALVGVVIGIATIIKFRK